MTEASGGRAGLSGARRAALGFGERIPNANARRSAPNASRPRPFGSSDGPAVMFIDVAVRGGLTRPAARPATVTSVTAPTESCAAEPERGEALRAAGRVVSIILRHPTTALRTPRSSVFSQLDRSLTTIFTSTPFLSDLPSEGSVRVRAHRLMRARFRQRAP